MTGGQPYCEACYKAATCPSCHVCGHIVDGDGVKIGDKGDLGGTERIYHTQCVRCVLELETKVIRRFAKISQSLKRPLLGPSPG